MVEDIKSFERLATTIDINYNVCMHTFCCQMKRDIHVLAFFFYFFFMVGIHFSMVRIVKREMNALNRNMPLLIQEDLTGWKLLILSTQDKSRGPSNLHFPLSLSLLSCSGGVQSLQEFSSTCSSIRGGTFFLKNIMFMNFSGIQTKQGMGLVVILYKDITGTGRIRQILSF